MSATHERPHARVRQILGELRAIAAEALPGDEEMARALLLLEGAVDRGWLADAAAGDLLLTRVADVEARPVLWLWRGRVPRGCVTSLDGDPGLGKSTVALDLAARVSTGTPMPDGTPGVLGGVVILSAEDSIAHTIRPRLAAAGADLDRVAVLEGIRTEDGPRPVALPDDAERIEAAVTEVGAALVVVDPLAAYLGGEVDGHRDQHVRRALHPLAALADRAGAAVVVIRHLRKSASADPLYRGGGSIGIVAAARSALLVARDPEDEHRRVLAPVKNNLSAPAPSLAWRLVAEGDVARVAWEGESPHDARALLAVPADPQERTERDGAREWLEEALAGGAMPVRDLKREAAAAGSWRTVERAKPAAGVEPLKSGWGTGWLWRLREGPKTATTNAWRPSEGNGRNGAPNPAESQEDRHLHEDRHLDEGPEDVAAFVDPWEEPSGSDAEPQDWDGEELL